MLEHLEIRLDVIHLESIGSLLEESSQIAGKPVFPGNKSGANNQRLELWFSVWSEDPGESLNPFKGIHKVKTIYIIIL